MVVAGYELLSIYCICSGVFGGGTVAVVAWGSTLRTVLLMAGLQPY